MWPLEHSKQCTFGIVYKSEVSGSLIKRTDCRHDPKTSPTSNIVVILLMYIHCIRTEAITTRPSVSQHP